MASIKYFPGVDKILGSRGGSNFSRNSSGWVIRKKVKPLLKRTVNVTAIRAQFRYVKGLWRKLTPAQQQTFWDVRDDYIKPNPTGIVESPQGPQIHQETVMPLAVAGLPPIYAGTYALIFPFRSIEPSTFTLGPFRLWIYLDDLTLPTDYIFKFWASPINFGERVNQFPDKFKLCATFDSAMPDYYDITAGWLSAYKSAPGQNLQLLDSTFVSVALQLLSTTTGQQKVISQANIPLFYF